MSLGPHDGFGDRLESETVDLGDAKEVLLQFGADGPAWAQLRTSSDDVNWIVDHEIQSSDERGSWQSAVVRPSHRLARVRLGALGFDSATVTAAVHPLPKIREELPHDQSEARSPDS